MSFDEIKPHSGPIRIDVGAVLESRLGAKSARVPHWVVRRLESLIRQDRLNEMLRVAYPRRGAEFCRAVIDHLGITVQVNGISNMPAKDQRRVIFVSNHPLGGLDGMALIDFVASHYSCSPRFVVNDLLMAVEPLREVFLPINKHGAQSRESITAIDEAMEADVPVIIFPAGLCSRRRRGKVADLEWRKMFVQKAREFHRDIVPIGFRAENSPAFYRAARWRERLGIKLNIEMALLPGEIFKAEGKTFTVNVGKIIEWNTLTSDTRAETARIRRTVDQLLKQV